MDVERSSLCNWVVNFLLEENYLLTAFELLHELLDDGRDDQAIRLKEFFSDPSKFPPDQISRFNSLRVLDPQSLLEEKEALVEKLTLAEYDLRLAREDVGRLKGELQKKADFPSDNLKGEDRTIDQGLDVLRKKKDTTFSDLGSLKDSERRDLNCAVKEYLLIAGYRLTAMAFYEEVADQNLDVWENTPACVSDALRHYYYQYLSSTSEAAEVLSKTRMEKIAILRENQSLLEANERLSHEKDSSLKCKDLVENQVVGLTKSLEGLQRDLKDRENLIQKLKQSLDHQRKELNDCRAEITSLKMHIEGYRSGRSNAVTDANTVQSKSLESYKEEIIALQIEIEKLKDATAIAPVSEVLVRSDKDSMQAEEKIVEMNENKTVNSDPIEGGKFIDDKGAQSLVAPILTDNDVKHTQLSDETIKSLSEELSSYANTNTTPEAVFPPLENTEIHLTSSNLNDEAVSETTGVGTIQILADALPKIVPYVLINHREELLPLMMCAIERHPDGDTRDSLTHTLFNLIKRPDEQQRRIIMDACVTLARNVGEMRTETELLPQCWEQINHMYEERRLLVAQSCGELAEFVRPEIRDSLILSIIQQLIEDSATVVREAAARNLALLLPLFPNVDKYFKVEELMFQLVCDPSGVVVETTLKELLPAVINWGNKLDHILRVLFSHSLSFAQNAPPLSGVEGSLESHLRVLGERERWDIDVLLRMLVELLPFIYQKALQTCPFSSFSDPENMVISSSLLEMYAREHVEWPYFEWVHAECFPDLIQLVCFLPQKEDNLRNRISKFLLAVAELFGEAYLTHIMLPVFFIAVGDKADMTFLPSSIHSRIKGLSPSTAVGERLAVMCILPLLLAGLLGAPSKHKELAAYIRKLLIEGSMNDNQSTTRNAETLDALRFLCTFEEHHGLIFNILWEMVVSTHMDMKIITSNLLKVIVPYIDAKAASTHVLPALITLGSDQNLSVKYASIDALGAVAQHFKNDMIVDKIRVQMDAFLEDGSQEATIAVVRALTVAVPHTTERLRDYLLSKIFHLTANPISANDVLRRRERANAFCEAIRALDATDVSPTSVREYLLPAIQNLIKDPDALDPAHKEALEIILKERSGGTFEAISKVMGAHLGLASSVSSFFGEGGILGKKETADTPPAPPQEAVESPKHFGQQPPVEDTRFRRIMRGNFTDMLRGKTKTQDETNPN